MTGFNPSGRGPVFKVKWRWKLLAKAWFILVGLGMSGLVIHRIGWLPFLAFVGAILAVLISIFAFMTLLAD